MTRRSVNFGIGVSRVVSAMFRLNARPSSEKGHKRAVGSACGMHKGI